MTEEIKKKGRKAKVIAPDLGEVPVIDISQMHVPDSRNSVLTYSDVKDPVWGNEAHTLIVCQVKFDNFDDYIPFGAAANDLAVHGQCIWSELINGAYGEIAEFDNSAVSLDERHLRAVSRGFEMRFRNEPTLCGTYPLSDSYVNTLFLEAQYVRENNSFFASKVHHVRDIDGNVKVFDDPKVFIEFVDALFLRAAMLRQAKLGNGDFPNAGPMTIR